MPYASTSALPAPVKAKLKGKKQRQWMHVFNSAYDRHGDESRAFAEAWATVKKAVIISMDMAKADKASKAGAKYTDKSRKIGQQCSICTMFMPPHSCSTVEGIIAEGGWCMYFARKSEVLGKATVMSDFQFFMPIAKVDKHEDGTCVVSGYASTPTKDADGEIVTLEAIKKALPGYMEWRNIREMHQLRAVGKAQEANIDTKGLWLQAKIIDPAAVQKCVEEVYKGFSIGGRKLAKVGDSITEIDMTEISIVDRPANPDARFSLAKSVKAVADEQGYLIKSKPKASPEAKALAKMARIVEGLAKAGPPAAHDGFSLPAEKAENASPKDPSEENNKAEGEAKCEKHGVVGCEKCALEKREFDAKERQAAAGSGAALPDGSFPIKNVSDLHNAVQAIGRAKNPGKAKAHIKARARALGATDALPDKWSKKARKLAKRKLAKTLGFRGDSFLTLRKAKEAAPEPGDLEKGMNVAGSLSYCFDSLRDAQRRLMVEAKQEGGDMKDKALAKELGTIAEQLAKVISKKAEHEGSEAATMTDADDAYLTSILGEDFDMDKVATANGGTGDAIADALQVMMKRAAVPTRAMRLAAADGDIKKARKACKTARESIEEAHKMHKAAYVAKMAKAKGGKEPDGDEFDHAGAMEKLQKAYAELDKARTFGKAAQAQLAKAAGRTGQSGQEVGDGDSYYQVPPGVKDLSPSALSGAGPGTPGGGGQPPAYPDDGSVYPGKAAPAGDLAKYAKNGQISADVAELIMAKAKSEGELEALRRLPAQAAGGRRPYAFDMSKVSGSEGGGPDSLNKALFDGVDPVALGSDDETRHTAASARVIGNFLTSGHFGKSVFDPAFKGAAGSGR